MLKIGFSNVRKIMNKEIYKLLNIKDPYPRIKSLNLNKTESPNWGGRAPIFDKIIKAKNPKLILELGSYLGDSTITMAKSIQKHGFNSIILTIDTWLGSQEHWLQDKCNLLHVFDHFENGISTLYDKCLTNFIQEDVSDYIIPVPTTTDTAFDILSNLGFQFDIIYMDADHREDVVYNDLLKYSSLLSQNGILFGHDIDWLSVKKGVSKYCFDRNMKYTTAVDENGQEKFWRIV